MQMPQQKNKKPVIGITGGIGSGKSIVASKLADLGCAVINADHLAQDVLKLPDVIDQIAQQWGDHVVADSGEIDRKQLADIVFNDPQQLDWLEQLIHPRVHEHRHALRNQYLNNPDIPAIVEDCPLLLEKELDKECDIVIFVRTDRENQLKRVAENRGWTHKQLQDRENNQIPLDIKAKQADYVIVNNADLGELQKQVRRVFSLIIENH